MGNLRDAAGPGLMLTAMAPKHHPTPLSGGDRKALTKELSKARAMTGILAGRSEEKRQEGIALIREADDLLCQSWNEKMWSDGGPVDPSPTLDQAINGGYPWLEIECSRCRTPRSVDLCSLRHTPTTCVHDLGSRLRCAKCREAGKRPAATLLQLGKRQRHAPGRLIMTPLSRRRDPDRAEECWLIFADDVHVGTIARAIGNPGALERWQWHCGFYPGSKPGDQSNGTAGIGLYLQSRQIDSLSFSFSSSS
jgi:hypothetical protein